MYINGGTTTYSTGALTSSTAPNGAGVYLAAGTFTMSGGSITGNSANSGNGGGIYAAASTTVELSGTSAIKTNTAKAGGGIYAAASSCTIKAAGKVVVNENTDTSSKKSNVHLVGGSKITVTAAFTSGTTKIGITAATNGVFTSGFVSKSGLTATVANITAIFPMDNNSTASGKVYGYTSAEAYIGVSVAEPTFTTTAITYDGNAKVLATAVGNTGYMVKVNNTATTPTENGTNYEIKKTDAGDYAIVYTLATGYLWATEANRLQTQTMSRTVTIARKKITAPTAATGLTYDGTAKTVLSGYDANTMTITSGSLTQTDAGTYSTQITPKSNWQWSSGSATTSAVTVSTTIARKAIDLPTGLTVAYNGKSQNLISGYNTTYMTTTDSMSGTNAQTYSFSFTPTKNYQWSSGSNKTGAATVNATITPKEIAVNWSYAGATLKDGVYHYVYNGAAQGPTASTTDACATNTEAEQIQFTDNTGWVMDVSTTNAQSTTVATIKAVLKGNARVANYTIKTGGTSAKFVIDPRPVYITEWDYTGAATLDNDGVHHYIYNNAAQSPEVKSYENVLAGTNLIFGYNNQIKDATTTAKQAVAYIDMVDGGRGKTTNYTIVTLERDSRRYENLSEEFVVDKADVANATLSITTAANTIIYKGAAWEPEYTLSYLNLRTTDYNVVWQNNVNAGTATLKIETKAASTNFKGEKTVNFTIIKANLSSVTVSPIKPVTYTGSGVTPADEDIEVKLNADTTLTIGAGNDFTAVATNNTFVSNEAVLTLTAVNKPTANYTGTKVVNFKIVGATLTDETADREFTYNGKAQSLVINVSGFLRGNESMTENTNMQVKWGRSAEEINLTDKIEVTDAGSHRIYYTITFDNYQTITDYRTITINKASVRDDTENVEKVYDGEAVGLTFVLSNVVDDDENKTLEQLGAAIYYAYEPITGGTQTQTEPITFAEAGRSAATETTDEYSIYTVYYKIVTTNYVDVVSSRTIKIKKAVLAANTTAVNAAYNGAANALDIELSGFTGHDESDRRNLVIKYSLDEDAAKAGSGSTTPVTLTDVGSITVWYQVTSSNFLTLNASQTITVTPRSLATYGQIEFTDANQNYVYTSKEVKPGIQVKDIGEGDNAIAPANKIIAQSNYSVTYRNNINASVSVAQQGVIIVVGEGNYTGTLETRFVIKKAVPQVIAWPVQRPLTEKRVYVGETLAEVERDITEASVVNSADTSVSVLGLGTFQWVDLTQQMVPAVMPAASREPIANFKAKYAMTFVLNDPNYEQIHISTGEHYVSQEIDVEAIYLTVSVVESFPEDWEKATRTKYYPITFKQKSFNIVEEDEETHERTVIYDTFYDEQFGKGNTPGAGTTYAGYVVNFSAYALQGTVASIGIVENKTINVTYQPAPDTHYSVYHVLMDSNGEYPFDNSTDKLALSAKIAAELEKGEASRIKLVEMEGLTNGTVTTEVTKIKYVDPLYAQLELQYFAVDNNLSNDIYPKEGTINGDGSSRFFVFYRRNQYTLTYSLSGNGSSMPAGKSLNVSLYYGQVLSTDLDVTPIRTGFHFDGWYTDYDNRGTEGYEVQFGTARMGTAAIKIYAAWAPEEYTITFNTGRDELDAVWDGELYGQTLEIYYTNLENMSVNKKNPVSTDNGMTYTVKYTYETSKITLQKISSNAYSNTAWIDDSTGKAVSYISKGSSGDISLTAQWEPKKFTVVLNANGGSIGYEGKDYKTRSITVANESYYPLEIFPDEYYAEHESYYYEPKRTGYMFKGWAYTADAASDELESSEKVWLVKAQTLYAVWEPKQFELRINENSLTTLDVVIAVNGVEDSDTNNIPVRVGDLVSVTFTPFTGYSLGAITLDATNQVVSNGRAFTITYAMACEDKNDPNYVEGEENDLFVLITAKSSAIQYSITYNENGGTKTNDWKVDWANGSIKKQYTVTIDDDMLYLPTNEEKDYIVRTGYTFLGWTFVIGDPEPPFDYIDRASRELYGNITLYAEWTAAPQEVVFHDNFIADGATEEETWSVLQFTGDNLSKYVANGGPNSENLGLADGFITTQPNIGATGRNLFEFAGWATSSDGAVVYPATYVRETVGGEDVYRFTGVDGDYTVKPSDNHLYAKWRVANAQYVIINIDNNNGRYGDNPEGVVLKPTPRYEYKITSETDDITMYFNWYYIDGESVEVDGTNVLVDGNVVAPIKGSGGIDAKVFYSAVADDVAIVKDQTYLHVHDVKDSGRYFCLFYVRGVETQADGSSSSGIASWSQASGEVQVFINKATLSNITLSNATVEYDGDVHTLKIKHTVKEGLEMVDDTDAFIARLAEQGITYNAGAEYSDAGTYTVTVSFTIPEDANYTAISPFTAELTITKRKITGINWVSNAEATEDEDPDKEEGIAFKKTYDGRTMTVTPQILIDLKQGGELATITDANLVAAVVENGSALKAGVYTAIIKGLEGELANNYTLDGIDTALTELMTLGYKIEKERYNFEVTFEDKETVYDGEVHEIEITGLLPVDVTVEYSVEYTPFTEGVTSGSTSKHGGVNAGVYSVTAAFAGDYDNYETVDSIVASLTVNKAEYVLDYGAFRSGSFGYDSDKAPDVALSSAYKPVIADENLVIFEASYLTEELNTTEGSYTPGITRPGKVWNAATGKYENDANSFYDSGTYRITATLDFIKSEGQYTAESVVNSNNYNIPAPKVITYTIGLPDVEKIVAEYTPSTVYKVGDEFDRSELQVIAYYKLTVNGVKETRQRVLNEDEYTLHFNRSGRPEFDGTFRTVGNAGMTPLLVYYGGVGLEDGIDGENGFTVRVNKGTIDVGGVTIVNRNVYYDGLYHLPTVTDLPEGVTVYYTLNGDETETRYTEIEVDGKLTNGVKDARSYTFTVHFATIDTDNYEDVTTVFESTVRIAPKTLALNFEVADHGEGKLVYDGTAYTLTIRGDFVDGDEGRTFEVDIAEKTDAGTYVSTVSAIYFGEELDGNYALPTVSYYEWTIEQRVVNIEFVEEDFVFNGEEQAVKVNLFNLVDEGVAAVIRYGGLEFKRARSYTATVVGFEIDGERATNYKLPSEGLSKDYTIAPRQVYTAWYVAGNKVSDTDNPVPLAFANNSLFGKVTVNMYYSEDPSFTESSFTETGVKFVTDESGERISLRLSSNQGTFMNKGDYVITATCTDTDYELLDDDMQFVVVAAEREVTWYYSVTAEFASRTKLTLESGDPVEEYAFTYTGKTVYFKAEFKTLDGTTTELAINGTNSVLGYQEGGYTINADFISTIHANNYTLINSSLHVTVEKARLAINWSELTYNGSEQTLTGTVTGKVGTNPITIEDLTGNKGTNADEYTANFKLVSSAINNYYLDEEFGVSDGEGGYNYVWTINQKVLDVTWGEDPVYDGTNKIPEITVVDGILADGDEVSFTYEVRDASGVLGSYYTVTGEEYTVVLTGVDNDNYTVVGMSENKIRHSYTLLAATPEVEVSYNEYEENKSFVDTALRNEKLTFTAAYGGEDIDGTVEFADLNALEGVTVGNVALTVTFTPDAKYGQDYAPVTKTLTIAVEELKPAYIYADTTGMVKKLNEYRNGEQFMPDGIVLYKAYNNYYEEEDEAYGRKDLMDSTATITYWQGSKNLMFNPVSVNQGELASEITIDIKELNNFGAELFKGEIKIFVTARQVTRINAIDGVTMYYEGQTFETGRLTLNVTYADGGSDIITGTGITVNKNEPLTLSDVSVTAYYGGKQCEVNIFVQPKQSLTVVTKETENKRLTESNIEMPLAMLGDVALEPGTPVAIGGTGDLDTYTIAAMYSVTKDGSPVSYSKDGDKYVLPGAQGTYTITVTYVLSNEAKVKYNTPAQATTEVKVSEVPVVDITVQLDDYTYLDEEMPEVKITVSIDGVEVDDVTVAVRYATTVVGPYNLTERPVNCGTYYVKGFVDADGESAIGGVYKANTEGSAYDSFTINKAVLTVKVKDVTVYDNTPANEIPDFEIESITGFRGTDTEEVLIGTPTFVCNYDRENLHPGHTHDVFVTGYFAANYTISNESAGKFIIVDHNAKSITLKATSDYKLDEIGGVQVITGVVGSYMDDVQNTVEQVLANFEGTFKVFDIDGNEITGDALVGTGCTIQTADGNVSATFILAGDVSGDGLIDGDDLFMLDLHTADMGTIDDPILFSAADVNGDGYIDGDDLFMLDLHTAEMGSLYDSIG